MQLRSFPSFAPFSFLFLVLTPFFLPVCFCVDTGQLGNAALTLGNALGGSGVMSSFRTSVPRWGYPSAFDPYNQKYEIGVGIQAVYGLVLALGIALGLVVYLVTRCCCPSCGTDAEKVKRGFTARERWGPYAVLVVFLLASLLFSGLGLYYNDQVSSTMQGSAGNIQTVLGLFSDTFGFINNMQYALNSISSALTSDANQINALLGATTVITHGNPILIAQVNSTTGNMENLVVTVNGSSYVCSYCTSIASQQSLMNTQIYYQTNYPITYMQSSIISINDNLVSIESSINSSVLDASVSISNANGSIQNAQSVVQTQTNLVKAVDNYRNYAIVVLFLLPCTFFIYALIGGIFKTDVPFTILWISSFLLCILLFIAFAVHLPFAVVLADGCVYLNANDQNVTSLVSNGNTGELLQACLQNTSLVNVYDLETNLNFTNSIVYYQANNITSLFTFSSVNSYIADVLSLNISTFGFNATAVQYCYQQLNALTSPDYFVYSNLSSCVPSLYPNSAAVANLVQNCSSLSNTQNVLTQTLNQMQLNVTNLAYFASNYTNNVTAAYNNLNSISSVTSNLYYYTNLFQSSCYCGFVGARYQQLKSNMCSSILMETAMLAFIFFLIGIFNLFGAFLSCCLVVRIKRLNNQEIEDGARQTIVIQFNPAGQNGTGTLPRPNFNSARLPADYAPSNDAGDSHAPKAHSVNFGNTSL